MKYYQVHTDHLGTPRAISNNQNEVLWRWEGDQFGDVLPQSPVNLVMPLRHAGQYYDAEVNLFYNYFRDYDPITGRYVESDPIGLDGGLNTYGYVGGVVLDFTDSKGLYCERKIIASIPIGSRLLSSNLIDVLWNPGIHSDPYLTAKSASSITLGAINNAKGGSIATCTLIKNNLYKDTYIQILRRLELLTCKDECGKTDISFTSYETTGGAYEKERRESYRYQKQMRTFLPELDCIKWFNKVINGN